MKKVYLYKGYERFWHWTQAVLVLFLILTGFEIHGSYSLFGYENAVRWHDNAAWAFLILIVFTMFWHITSGEWKQYVPTAKNLRAQLRYYLTGIFNNAPHPTGKRLLSKLNPLQRLTYFALNILIIPLMVISGFLYLYFNYPMQAIELDSLEPVALIHTIGAYIMITFLVIHLYLITTGRTIFSNLKAIITGWEEMDEHEAELTVKDVMDTAKQYVKESNNGKKKKK
ncbi:MAG: cytochrome b/b6 domain-containing protein [Bacteroidales bacterium]|jgi:thiosulfate reductase cytochrome b subunit|nr:cytochrome b/b6 domain-containing protein [Bacteroidales bacterium]